MTRELIFFLMFFESDYTIKSKRVIFLYSIGKTKNVDNLSNYRTSQV